MRRMLNRNRQVRRLLKVLATKDLATNSARLVALRDEAHFPVQEHRAKTLLFHASQLAPINGYGLDILALEDQIDRVSARRSSTMPNTLRDGAKLSWS